MNGIEYNYPPSPANEPDVLALFAGNPFPGKPPQKIRAVVWQYWFTDLATNPAFSTSDFSAVPGKYRTLIPEYVKDYVSLNQFVA